MLAAIASREGISASRQGYRLNIGEHLTVAGPLFVAGWVLAIALFGGYRAGFFGAGTEEYKAVLRGSSLAAALIGIGCYLARFQLSRGFYVLLFLIGIPMLLAGRYVLREALHHARARGRVRPPGGDRRVGRARRRDRQRALPGDVAGLPGRGRGRAHRRRARDHRPRRAAPGRHASPSPTSPATPGPTSSSSPAAPSTAPGTSGRLAWDLEQDHIEVVIAPSVTDVARERVSIRPVGGLPLIHLEKPRSIAAVRRAKRTFDVVGSASLLLAFSPLFAYAALRVWLHDRGPVLFRQPRVGRDGAEFECLKFRSMVTDAEERLGRCTRRPATAAACSRWPTTRG